MKWCLSFLFYAAVLGVFAQNVQVSDGYKLPPKTNKFKVIGKNNDGIIVRLYGQQEVIDVFDENLKLSTTHTLDLKNQSGLFQYIMLNKNGAVIFYLVPDKKYSVLLAQPVNSRFLEIGKPIAVDTIYDRRDLVASNLRFKVSVDQSYLMVYYPFFSGSNIQSIKFLCVDRSLRAIYNKTIPVNRDEKALAESRALVDNNGNSFLVLNAAVNTESATFDVLRIDSAGNFSMYALLTKKALFGEAGFDIDNKNGNLLMSAFYNDDRNADDVANGFLFASYNPVTGALNKTSYTPFTKEFMVELTGRATNADKGKLYTFLIRRTILRNDGGLLIVAESVIKDTREVPISVGFQPGFNGYRNSTVFQFNDIIAFSVKPNSDLDWHAVMRKKQSSEDDNGVYSSFLTVNEKDKLRFLYLDDISTAGQLVQFVLTSEGKNDRSVLFSEEDKEVMLLPKLGRQVSPNEAVIPSYLNGTLKLVKLTF